MRKGEEFSVGDAAVSFGRNFAVAGITHGLTKASGKLFNKVFRRGARAAAKGVKPPFHHTHHVVARNAKKAAPARQMLEKASISIDDAANKVFLPAKRGISQAAYHPSLHTYEYYDEVNRLLSSTTGKRRQVLKTLNYISTRLSSGTFP